MWGLDYLGGARYGDLIIREHPQDWAAGFFANTFGNAWPVIEGLLRTGRCPRVRVHAVWQDNHQYISKRDDPVILKEAARATKLQHDFPNVNVCFSPFCEHSIRGEALNALHRKLHDVLDHEITIVNSVYTGDLIDDHEGALNEVHGSHRKPKGSYNYSLDGTNGPDANIAALKATYGDAETFFLWGIRFNGNWNTGASVPRPNRKGWPDSRYIDSLIALSKDKGATKLPKNWLYKSHSENKGTGDPRAEKPVWIAPIKAGAIELRTDNGQVVDRARYYGPFADGRFRYYSGDWGYLIADKARRIQGHCLCEVWVNGKRVGVINPAFRDGSFR